MPSIKSLAARLFKLVFGWYLLLAIFVTCFQLGFEFLLIRSTISADMAALGKSFSPAVADAIWTYDQPLLESLIKGIGQASIITGAKIENNRGDILASVGRLPEAHEPKADSFLAPFQMYELPLWSKPLTESRVSRELGKLALYCDRDVVLVRIKYSFIVILINSLVKTAGLWLIFYWAITWRLSKPLTKLSQTVSTLNFRADEIEPEPIDYREQDEVGQLVAALNDMRIRLYTAHRELEKKVVDLAQARDDAEAANRAKSIFLANMSHELRTPLNAILGFTQIMALDDRIPEDERRNIATISVSGNHLLALINDVLEISRIEAGRTTVSNEAFDLPATLKSVEKMIRVRAEAKGLTFTVESAGDLPGYVQGDAHRLRQVLLNLLGNAVKYTDRGRISLNISVLTDRKIHFEVSDSGPGIAEDDRERIFKAFYQTTGGVTKGEGTGLGLTISREFVRLMGGDLTVKSELDRGSHFGFSIPLPVAQAVSHSAGLGRIVGLAAGQPAPRILVAEDKPDNQLVVEQLLKQIGCEVIMAANGEEAVELFQRWRPHLILMDMRMPVMDGYQATRAIRSLPGGNLLPMIALTATAFEEDKAEVLAAGCDEMLSKPIEAQRLFEAIGRLLGLRFDYAEADSEVAETIADLAALPGELRHELSQAAMSLDKENLLLIVNRLRPEYPAETELIANLAEDFRFDRIQDMLRQTEQMIMEIQA